MTISLVICTRNRAAQLAEMLRSLAGLAGPDSWEVVIVDNGSTDDTPDLLRSFAAGFSRPVTVVREEQPGQGRARQAGMLASRGEILAYTDDDCYPAPDFLVQTTATFADPAIGFAGGKVLLHDPTDYPITIQEHDRVERLAPCRFIPSGMIHGANMAFRRAALDDIGGFDVALGPGTPFVCDDDDTIARISAAGWQGIYNPLMLVHHHHRRKTVADARALMRVYDYGRGAYYAKCLLIPPLRRASVRAWLRSMRHAAPAATLRELVGGVRYLVARLTGAAR